MNVANVVGLILAIATPLFLVAALLFPGNPLPKYFQSSPSAAGAGYDPVNTCASNLGPESIVDTPADAGFKAGLLTTVCSRSAAVAQVAKARDVNADEIRQALCANENGRDLGFLGEPRVNVLALNVELDQKFPVKS